LTLGLVSRDCVAQPERDLVELDRVLIWELTRIHSDPVDRDCGLRLSVQAIEAFDSKAAFNGDAMIEYRIQVIWELVRIYLHPNDGTSTLLGIKKVSIPHAIKSRNAVILEIVSGRKCTFVER
jgi:hypothetical protein